MAANGTSYMMPHNQDCCEEVIVDDIVGELKDLIGNPILIAEETTSKGLPNSETV
jgi:hypothetical protein